ncbi:IS30 family transposase [Leuconostoc suionicum]|uniref:IS30 family transposase n=1 Tax=Leuconostoc suionicum TaxID=1511761 RepID=UPI002954C03B|nr:IS30 family transposase [Leuconostoc suionicum]MDV7703542.1 IS30 family transposase [Leuconostoc suionicum]
MTKKNPNSKYARLDFSERVTIKNMIDDGKTNAEIARKLNRPRPTITHELKRNARVITWRGKSKILRHTYEPVQADRRAEYHQSKSHHSQPKITSNKREKIDYYLIKKSWSPEQIAHGIPRIGVCTRTIYNWILKRHLSATINDLPLKGKRRRKLRAKPVNPERKRMMIETRSIHTRPEVIDNRSTFGHWEIDGVMSPQDSQSFVITFVERKTRFMVGVKAKSKNANDVKTAIDTFMSRFENVCDSITCDRGTEFTSTLFIYNIEDTYGKKLYYADPQSPGQRGSNERMNRELRRVFPAGYDFTKITQRKLQKAIQDINERPRNVLRFKTPEKVFTKRMMAA